MKIFFKHFGISLLYLLLAFTTQLIAGVIIAIVGFIVAIINKSSITQESLTKFISIYSFYAVAGTGFLTILIFLIIFKFRKICFRDTFKLHKISLISIFLISIIALASNVLLTFGMQLAMQVKALESTFNDYKKLTELFTGPSYIEQIIFIGILIPIIEEFFFRGLILNQLKKGMTLKVAVIIQGILFGIYHFNPVQSTYATLLGILLGAICIWSKSLIAPIIAHIVFNSSSVLIQIVTEKVNEDVLNKYLNPLIILPVVIFLFICSLFYLYIKYTPEINITAESLEPIEIKYDDEI